MLRDDDITRAIRYDELIILYGNKLCKKYRDQRHHDMIRSILRLLSRFLIALRKYDKNVTDFSSLYNPKTYNACILAVHKVAQFDPESNTYKVPSIASRLGTLIKKVGQLWVTECIKKNDNEGKQQTENFLLLLQDDFGTSVNKIVEETVSMQKRHKKVHLPLNEDIKKLYTYLTKTRTTLYRNLRDSFKYEVWLHLLQVTLISVQVFNRRRAGEIERVLIEDYKCQESIAEGTHPEIYNSLSESAQKVS